MTLLSPEHTQYPVPDYSSERPVPSGDKVKVLVPIAESPTTKVSTFPMSTHLYFGPHTRHRRLQDQSRYLSRLLRKHHQTRHHQRLNTITPPEIPSPPAPPCRILRPESPVISLLEVPKTPLLRQHKQPCSYSTAAASRISLERCHFLPCI